MTIRRSVLLLNLTLLMALTASGAAQPLNKRAVVQSADANNDSRAADANSDGVLDASEVNGMGGDAAR